MAGRFLGFSAEASARFSFLLAIPAISGACVLELLGEMGGSPTRLPTAHLLIGAADSRSMDGGATGF